MCGLRLNYAHLCMAQDMKRRLRDYYVGAPSIPKRRGGELLLQQYSMVLFAYLLVCKESVWSTEYW